jgi:hypothetical protein
MRLAVAALTMVLALGSTALAQTVDRRAPDQVAPSQQPVAAADLRAPDQVAPSQQPVGAADLRAPDQIAPAQQPVDPTDLRSPDQQSPAAAPTPPVVPDGGPATLVFVLIGLGAALVLVAGGYGALRYRHRPAIADDLVTG